MGNKVIVTRAPRFKQLRPENERPIPLAPWYRISNKGMVHITSPTGVWTCIENKILATDPLWEDARIHCEMERFEDVCQWVSGGRKLEDLQGDTISEYLPLHEVPIGTIFTCDFSYPAVKICCTQAIRLNGNIGNVILEFTSMNLVWPVRFDLGDTIAITAG